MNARPKDENYPISFPAQRLSRPTFQVLFALSFFCCRLGMRILWTSLPISLDDRDAHTTGLRIEPIRIEPFNRMEIAQPRCGRVEKPLPTCDQSTPSDSSSDPAYCERIAVFAAMGNHGKAEESFYIARQYKEE